MGSEPGGSPAAKGDGMPSPSLFDYCVERELTAAARAVTRAVMAEAAKLPRSQQDQENAQQLIKKVFAQLDWVAVQAD